MDSTKIFAIMLAVAIFFLAWSVKDLVRVKRQLSEKKDEMRLLRRALRNAGRDHRILRAETEGHLRVISMLMDEVIELKPTEATRALAPRVPLQRGSD